MKDRDKESMTNFGTPRRTGLYAGAFEQAQRSSTPIYAVAFRRSAGSIVDVFKVDGPEDANAVFTILLKEGVALNDMWPIAISVGAVDVSVASHMPTAAKP